jgi:putative ABC transport system permease protein
MAGAGVTVGLLAAFSISRRLQSQLFGLSPSDPATLAGATLLLMTVAMIAGFGPARRATAIDPAVALKAE